MLTRRNLNILLANLKIELSELGFIPDRMILFGSYANGGVHKYSDVDVAIWNQQFTGKGIEDFERIKPILSKFPNVDIKTYPTGSTACNLDPFIAIIEKTGTELL